MAPPPAKKEAPETATSSKLEARAKSIQRILDHCYPNPPIPLDHTDNFTLLIAVVRANLL